MQATLFYGVFVFAGREPFLFREGKLLLPVQK